jgi:tetratricopeptide (TPR) repeat protein
LYPAASKEHSVRKLLLSATLAATAGILPLAAATFVERQAMQDVELHQLEQAPRAWLNQRVRFRATFIELGQIYDPIHTPYSAERYVNINIWDDQARLFDPAVRAKPLVTLYLDKVRAADLELDKIVKYDVVEITGDISSTARGLPWVNVHTIKRIDSKRYSDNAIYHVEQATALARDGAYDLADARYTTALALELPASGRIAINEQRARALMTAGRFADASTVLTTALSVGVGKDEPSPISDADRATLHYLLAKCQGELADDTGSPQQQQHAYEQAVGNAQRAIALDPTNGDAYAVLGISLAGLGRFDEARRECAQAIRLQPQNAEVRWYLGRILDSQGQYDESIEALKKAIDLTPKDFRTHKAIAAAYHHRGSKTGPQQGDDLVTALREYDIAIRLNPSDAEAFVESGRVIETAVEAKAEVQIGAEKVAATPALAIERYQAALKIDPTNVPAQLALAKQYQAGGKTDDTVALYQQIIAADPNRLDAVQELVRLQVSQQKQADALATLEAYRAKNPGNLEVDANYGKLALELGQADKAVPALEGVTKAQPKNAGAQADLAEAYLAVGRTKDATKRAKIANEVGDEAIKARAATVIEKSK